MGSNHGKFFENKLEKSGSKINKKNIEFKINGKTYCVRPGNIPLDTTLNSFIRIYAGLTGTKFMCREGRCSYCTVLIR
ncbi:hypothetical protein DMENIID0001_168340 [Sergentomyia squamirostris]